MPPKRGKKAAAKKEPVTPAVDKAANGMEGDSSKNGETVDEEAPELAAKASKRSAKDEPKVGGKKTRKAKEAKDSEKEEEDEKAEEDEPIENDSEPESTKKSSSKSKKKDLKKKTAEENGADTETKSNRPKRMAAIANTSPKKQAESTKKGSAARNKRKAGNNKQTKEQYEVESIIDMKEKSGKREFLVKWKGYGSKQNTWEPEKNLNCPKILSSFLKKEGKAT